MNCTSTILIEYRIEYNYNPIFAPLFYSLRQELRWHLNNGCRIAHQNIDQLDQDSNLVPSTVDKSTETNFEFRANSDSSPDSTTTTVCVKKEPPCFEEPPRKTTL